MVWEEFVKAVDGVGVDAGQDVAEPGEGLDADELAGAGEAAQDGIGVAAGVAAGRHAGGQSGGVRETVPLRIAAAGEIMLIHGMPT